MQSAKQITNYTLLFIFLFLFVIRSAAQENSPYSRYGIGDLYPSQTVSARGMGGVTAAYSDGRSLNSDNPATYSDLKTYANGGMFTFDVGVSIDSRTLHNATPVLKYNSVNFIPSYIMVGFPLNKHHLGMVAGLKPLSRINYSIQSAGRGPDSMQTIYNGSGGLNQAFVGIGKRWGGLSLGVNGGYLFGRKEISTNVLLINDSIGYHNGNVSSTGNFGGLFANAGLQLSIKLGQKKDSISKMTSDYRLVIGAAGMLKQNIDLISNVLNETYYYSSDGSTVPYDTIKYQKNPTDKVTLPMMFNVGFMITSNQYPSGFSNLSENKWGIGAELSTGNWAKDYRYNNQRDQLENSWLVRIGANLTPNMYSNSFFAHTIYRLGFYTGKDYINADGNGLKTTAVTLGAGLRIRSQRYSNQSTIINTAIEIGKRGTNVNNVTENFFKISAGLSLSDLWFVKRKYD